MEKSDLDSVQENILVAYSPRFHHELSMRPIVKKTGVRVRWICILLLVAAFVSAAAFILSQTHVRDRTEQPERVMDATGVQPGMTIGEVGAGQGYFTFWLSRRVGETGKVYANDIDRSALSYIQKRCAAEGIRNIETIRGRVEDPLFPEAMLDMVFMVNSFHDLAKPVELLDNLASSLKPEARVVIMDRDPAKLNDRSRHFLTQKEVLDKIRNSKFELDRIETFLPEHNLYIIKLKNRMVG